MTKLVTQKSWWPTRKLLAMIISGAILGIVQTLLRSVWPDNPLMEYLPDIDIWLQGFIMIAIGYFVRNEENVDVDKLEAAAEQVGADRPRDSGECADPVKVGQGQEEAGR